MKPESTSFSRRNFLRIGTLAIGSLPALNHRGNTAESVLETSASGRTASLHPLLTPSSKFVDVSRGEPRPHSLEGVALEEARLTPETWRCEITADPFVEEPHTKLPASLAKPLTHAAGNALDLPLLLELGKTHGVHFLKAMQCLNIDTPLGQGIWSGVPLCEVLKLCGKMQNVRRIYFLGFYNNDPKQVFKSSVSYTQCMETPPGDLPVFLAYQLNGSPLSLLRGGPVRMIVPWSHGYKSIKWLQHIFVTNDPRNSDTYANGNNDPDSYLKTAAYVDKEIANKKFKEGEPVVLTGQVISGLSGVKRVEYWVRRVEDKQEKLADDAPEILQAEWTPCELEPQPDWSRILHAAVRPQQLLGFDQATGKLLTWPPRYGMCSYSATLRDLKPGLYEVRARAVDLNGFTQPEPRPAQKNGKNAIQVRQFEVV